MNNNNNNNNNNGESLRQGQERALLRLLNKQSNGTISPQEQARIANLSRQLGLDIAGPVSVNPRALATQPNRRTRRARAPPNINSNNTFPPLVKQMRVGNRLQAQKELNGIPDPSNALGATQSGKDWAMAALHPCGADAPLNVGLPDTITSAVVTPHYNGEYEISFDVTMFADAPPGPVTTWSCEVVTPPIPEIAMMYRIRDDSANKWSRWRVHRLPGFTTPATPDTTGTTLRSLGYAKHRLVAKGETFELNASALNNQGRVISGQLELAEDFDDYPVQYTSASTAKEGDINPGIRVITMRVPDTEQSLVAVCPRVYQEEAREGAYIVHKFDGPLLGYDFVETGSAVATKAGATADHPALSFPATALNIIVTDDPLFEELLPQEFTDDSMYQSPSVIGNGNLTDRMTHPHVSLPSRMLSGVTFFLGMPISTTSPSPTIRVKTRVYFECLANANPGVAPFAHPAPLRDMVAIDRVVGVMQTYDDAYPASFNGFGDILGEIWNGISSVADTVGNVWTNYVKPIGDVIQQGVGLAAMF